MRDEGFHVSRPRKRSLSTCRKNAPYIDCIQKAVAPIPEKETKTTTSYYSVQDGLILKSYLPGQFRKRITFRDQLLVLETAVIKFCRLTTATFRPDDTAHSDRPTTKSARNIGGRPYAASCETGASNNKLVNDDKHHTTDQRSRQAICLSRGPSKEYRWTW